MNFNATCCVVSEVKEKRPGLLKRKVKIMRSFTPLCNAWQKSISVSEEVNLYLL